MAESLMPVELVEYARNLFAPYDDAQRALALAAQAFGMPKDWEISPDVGRLFQVLCQAVGARRVVEFGTLAGHSALWLARSIPADGTVISIEMNPAYAEFAREQLALTDAGYKIDIRVGAALEMLSPLTEEAHTNGLFDVIFLDADKARYPEFLDWSVGVLRPGGLLLADNVLRSGSWNEQTLLDPKSDDPRILAIRNFNRRLAVHPQFTASIIPMRSGIAVGIFKGRT